MTTPAAAAPPIYQAPLVPPPKVQSRTQQIGKQLHKQQSSGRRLDQIFRDWIQLLAVVLQAMNSDQVRQLQTGDAAQTRAFIDHFLRGETGADGRRRDQLYQERHWDRFGQATDLLLQGVRLGYADYLSPLYGEYGLPNKGLGQFFTPWSLALFLAQANLYDVILQVETRLSEAYRRFYLDPARPAAVVVTAPAGATTVSSQAEPSLSAVPDEAEPIVWTETLIRLMLPILRPYFTPYRILDPAVGAATLLLAAASFVPFWMIELGLVEFYAVELDPFVASLARVNCGLYGIPLRLAETDFLRLRTELKFDVILANPPFAAPGQRERRGAGPKRGKRRDRQQTT
jgi:hypothetical protein